jgi:serine/threonine protein kinase
MSADRNLLFGVLALQMDFIDRDQLVRAMNAWVLEKHRPLAEILVEEGALAHARRALLEPLVEEHVRAHGGDPQRSLAALSSVSSLREELSRVTDSEVQASVQALGNGDPHATRPPSVGTETSSAGRFQVLRPHAKGGLGEVFVARDDELEREVALKEIQDSHADNPGSRARFLLEARVTGRLEHPGVIPVYGLGHYADGRPFYAMRFVKGDSLGEAIARFHQAGQGKQLVGERGVEFRRLLGRFVDVCQAVAYAHSKGVLHRDLKPGNVLLGPYGETLVIDWGLAKLYQGTDGEHASPPATRPSRLTRSEAEGVSPTVAGQVIGTPAYMPPEQAAGEVDKLGPASDVYGLGATLYALLTGRAPVEDQDPLAVLRRVQKGDFPQPRAVCPAVPAALEAVCLKAMALCLEDRYRSPNALAEELECWLADEPVGAYAEPLTARLRRQLRRHPAALAAAAALLVTGLVGLGLGLAAVKAEQRHTAEQRDLAQENAAEAEANAAAAREQEGKAREAAARAEAVNTFLTDDLLAQASPEKNPQDKQVTVEQLLDKAATKVAKGFPGQPLVEGAVRLTLARTYEQLGRYAKGEPHARQALELYCRVLGPEHPDTLAALDNLAVLLQDQGKLAEAEPLFRQNLETLRRVLGPEHPDTLGARGNLASLLHQRGKLTEAEPLFRQDLEASRRVLGLDHRSTLTALNNLALLLHQRGKLTEAEPLFRQSVEASSRVLGPEHPDTLGAVNNLALLLQGQGKLTEAEPLFRQNLEAKRRVLGPEHPDTLTAEDNLAMLLQDQGKLTEAEPLSRQSVAAFSRVLGPEHPDTLTAVNNLALLFKGQGKLTEAEPLFRQNLEARRRVQGPDHPLTLIAVNNLAVVLQDEGKPAEAEPLFRQNLEARRRVLGPDHLQTLVGLDNLALVLRDQGKLAAAEELAREALARARRALPANHAARADSLGLLGGIFTDTGRAAEAEPLLREALEKRRKGLPPGHQKTAEMESLLGACLAAQHKFAEAEPLLVTSYQVLAKVPGTSVTQRHKARQRLVQLYDAWGKPAEAANWKAKSDQEVKPAGTKTP